MSIRLMYGMSYKSLELEHDVRLPMSSVLRQIADYVEANRIEGILTHIYTKSHPDDEDMFLTDVVWAEF